MSSGESHPSLIHHADRNRETWKHNVSAASLIFFCSAPIASLAIVGAAKIGDKMDESRLESRQEVSADLMQLYPGIEVTEITLGYGPSQSEGVLGKRNGTIKFINTAGRICNANFVQVDQVGQASAADWEFETPTCSDNQF